MNLKNRILFILLFSSAVFCFTACDQKSSPSQADNTDTLNYCKTDYEKMQAYYLADAGFVNILTKQSAEGDDNASKMLTLLHTPYEEVLSKLNMDKKDLDLTILAFYTSKKHMDNFNALDSLLPTNTADIHQQTDSIVNIIHQLRDSLEH